MHRSAIADGVAFMEVLIYSFFFSFSLSLSARFATQLTYWGYAEKIVHFYIPKHIAQHTNGKIVYSRCTELTYIPKRSREEKKYESFNFTNK